MSGGRFRCILRLSPTRTERKGETQNNRQMKSGSLHRLRLPPAQPSARGESAWDAIESRGGTLWSAAASEARRRLCWQFPDRIVNAGSIFVHEDPQIGRPRLCY